MVAKTRTGVAAPPLKRGKKLAKKTSAKHDAQESGVAIDENAQSSMDKAAKRAGRASTKEKHQQRNTAREAKREAARKKWVDSGKALPLCSLATVEVKKGNDGFHVSFSGSQGNRAFIIPPDQTTQVLRDLETAILVMRNQQ